MASCLSGPTGLLLLTAFLLHVRLSRMSPTRLVCDSRLIHKYIAEAKDMERRAVRPRPAWAGAFPWLGLLS